MLLLFGNSANPFLSSRSQMQALPSDVAPISTLRQFGFIRLYRPA